MARPVSLVAAAALVCFLASGVLLARLERGGPAHSDVWLEGGVPATLYLPDGRGVEQAFQEPPAQGARPPALVLMHGFSGDRRGVAGLARRLAAGGIAVLAFDAAGHGENRNPYRRTRARADAFAADFASAVDFLRMSPSVDGLRIAVAGHSMGAGAALDYASRDAAVAATVLISGGRRIEGPFPPRNALVLYASGDPPRIRARAVALAAQLAGGTAPVGGESRGRPERGDAVRLVEVAGAHHVDVVGHEETARETLAWLRAAFGMAPSSGPTPGDPRAALLWPLALSFLALLPGVGLLAARLSTERPEVSGEGRFQDLAWLGAALVLTLPLAANAPRLAPVPLELGDVLASQLLLAGLVLGVAVRLRRPALWRGAVAQPRASLFAAGVALAVLVALFQPIGVLQHGLVLTPARAVAWLLTALAFLPLALASGMLLRRGPPLGAALAALAGRAVTLLVLALGIWLGVLPPVLGFLLPTLVLLALGTELLAGFLYAGSRDVLAVALVDAGWLAFVLAAILPVRG